jgi:hypothetical protein
MMTVTFHLKRLPAPGKKVHANSDWIYPVTHEFHISIIDFVKDIKNSTTKKPKGYLEMLKQKPLLRQNYENAINPEFNKLITSLRTAVEKGEGTLDKEATSHDDLFDAFRKS